MSDLVNDVRRIERVGSEISDTNQKLIAAASRLIDLILEAIPEDMPNEDLGMGCSLSGNQADGAILQIGFRHEGADYNMRLKVGSLVGIVVARAFADKMAAGLAELIRAKLEDYLEKDTTRVTALEAAELMLEESLS